MNLKFLIPICFHKEFLKREFNSIISARIIYSNLQNINAVENYIDKFFMISDDKIYKIKKIVLGDVDYTDINDLIKGNFSLFSMNNHCLVDSENTNNMEFVLSIEVKDWNIYEMTLVQPEEDILIEVVDEGKFVRSINKVINYHRYKYSYYGSAI